MTQVAAGGVNRCCDPSLRVRRNLFRESVHVDNHPEDVPTPMMYVTGRAAYAMTLSAGLKHASLSYRAYEFNAALYRALTTDNAERRWLDGEDIFHGIHQDPQDVLQHEQAQFLYHAAFPNSKT